MYAMDYNFTQHPSFNDTLGSGTLKRSLNYSVHLPNLNSSDFSDADVYIYFRKLYFVPETTFYGVSYKILNYTLGQVDIEISVEDGVQLADLAGYILIVSKTAAESKLLENPFYR